jgi:hypothetical protein
LLHLVQVYGHNWRFLADKFFEKRAPLSLKNRNSYLERRQKRQAQAYTSQRRGRLSSPVAKDPNALHILGSMEIPDAPINTSTPFPLSLYENPDGILHDASGSVPGSEMARLTRRNNSSMDLSNFFDTLATAPGMKQSSQSDPPQKSSLGANNITQDGEMLYVPDQAEWQSFMDSPPPFNHATETESNRPLGAVLGHNSAPILHAVDLETPNARNPSVDTTTQHNGTDTVEYSLTCPRSKVNSLVQHLVDAAMPVAVDCEVPDEQQVVLNLKLTRLRPHRS